MDGIASLVEGPQQGNQTAGVASQSSLFDVFREESLSSPPPELQDLAVKHQLTQACQLLLIVLHEKQPFSVLQPGLSTLSPRWSRVDHGSERGTDNAHLEVDQAQYAGQARGSVAFAPEV